MTNVFIGALIILAIFGVITSIIYRKVYLSTKFLSKEHTYIIKWIVLFIIVIYHIGNLSGGRYFTPLADNGTINIKEYGAKVDGATDDSIKIQQAIDYLYANGGGNILFPKGTTIINQEINLKSGVNLIGIGYTSKIKTTVGSSGNGLNLLKAFEQSNIFIRDLYIENLGFGKSGTWKPTGTFNGVGACILIVGCENVVVENCNIFKGGGANGTDEGIANIYFSCCKNSKIINNYVSLCDNGIVVDSWYNQLVGKENFINDGVVIQGNTVTQGGGRGICIENVSTIHQKGSIVVNGNTINKMAYCGIQGNNIFNCVITNNAIDGDKTGRTYGNLNYDTFYGIEFVTGSKQAIISNNTLRHFHINGIRCFEASELIVSGNNIADCEDYGIFIKNINDIMFNVKVDDNIVDVFNNGIFVGRDIVSVVTMYSNRCCNNTVKFNTIGSSHGIQFEYHSLSKCDGNIVKPVVSYGGSIAIKTSFNTKCSINNNIVQNVTYGIDLTNDLNSISDNNILENCTNGYIR